MNQQTIQSVFVTTSQASKLDGMSVKWHERQRLKGNGPPFVKLGSAVLYEKDELLEWFRQRKVRCTSLYTSHQKPPVPVQKEKCNDTTGSVVRRI